MIVGDLFYIVAFLFFIFMAIRGAYILIKKGETSENWFDSLCVVVLFMFLIIIVGSIVIAIINYVFPFIGKFLNYKLY